MNYYNSFNLVTIGLLFMVYVYGDMIHPLWFRSAESGEVALPFLPLILYSASCAVVLVHAWFMSVSILSIYLFLLLSLTLILKKGYLLFQSISTGGEQKKYN